MISLNFLVKAGSLGGTAQLDSQRSRSEIDFAVPSGRDTRKEYATFTNLASHHPEIWQKNPTRSVLIDSFRDPTFLLHRGSSYGRLGTHAYAKLLPCLFHFAQSIVVSDYMLNKANDVVKA
jgi:hypothetical protein